VSQLPPGWATTTIGEVADLSSGFGFAKHLQGKQSGRFPFAKVGDISKAVRDNAGQLSVAANFVDDDDLKILRAKPVPAGSTVFAKIGEALKLNRRALTTKPFVLDNNCMAASPKLCVEAGFLFLYFRTVDLSPFSVATTVPSVRKGDVESVGLGLPPLPEQRRIVAKIDSLSSKSKRAREHLDHIPRLVEKYKQAVLAAAFRGELTRAYRVNRRDASNCNDLSTQIIRERNEMRAERGIRSKGKNRSLPPKVANAVNLPSGWSWLTFDDCSWDMTVGHVGPMKDRYVDEGVVFLRSLNVRANRIDLQKAVYIDEAFDRELGKSRLHPGDLVVVRTGEPGVAAVIPDQLSKANCSDLVICRLVGHLNPNFAAYYMNSEYAKALVRATQVGVAQQHFNVGAMSEMPVPVPSLGEQNEIVRRIEGAFTWIDRLAAEATSARKLIDKLDQAVLAKAFRGELVPQDPDDEPANVLLERIRAERETAPAAKPRRGRAKQS
jgi:type I restriction enzyme S subunit